MSGINISLVKRNKAQGRNSFNISTPYDNRFGFWGTVTEVHPESCTVNVRMDTGQIIANVRVASMEWVTVVKDKPLTGERHLPPIDTFVFCMMPNGEINSSFVLCSGFAMAEAVHADFKKEGEDAANTWEKVENSGWKKTVDYRTGTVTLANKPKDETISIAVDQESEGEEKATITIHGNILRVTKDGIDIQTDKDITLEIKGNANVKVTKNAVIEAQNITVKSSVKTEIKGGQVVLGGTVTPTGKGALCGLPACMFTGSPHVGDTSNGA